MAIISDVKCSRCDRTYSGLRNRCPHCGARRSKRGRHSYDDNNSFGKLIIGVLLAILLIVAIVVMIVSGGKTDHTFGLTDPQPGLDSTTMNSVRDSLISARTQGIDTGRKAVRGMLGDPTAPSASPGTTPSVGNERLAIVCLGQEKTDFTIPAGYDLTLSYNYSGDDSNLKAEWESENPDIASIDESGEFYANSPGTTTITLKVGNSMTECIVRVTYADEGE